MVVVVNYLILNFEEISFKMILLGKRKPCIYDYYPELEIEAKIYVDQQVTKKECDFNLKDMAVFINDKYLELIGEIKTCETKETNLNLIRSERMVGFDLKRWAIDFNRNTKKPFFEGHERSDVVQHRKEFISYFLSRQDHYYFIGNNSLEWKKPIEKPYILIFHDESTFRSNEQSHSRWMKRDQYPFISKGYLICIISKLILVSILTLHHFL